MGAMDVSTAETATSGSKLKVAMLSGMNNPFIAELIWRVKQVPGIEVQHAIYWKPARNVWSSLRKNLRKHGLLYLIWRPVRLLGDFGLHPLGEMLERYRYAPMVRAGLLDTCAELGITVHSISDLHSAEGVAMVKSLDCDVLAVCGAGLLKKSIFSLPRLGTINLHQGEAPAYRGVPPGFWELWNRAERAGVTVHFIDAGVDSGDIILQKTTPILAHDTPQSLQKKLNELSLSLFPQAIERLAGPGYPRQKQMAAGKQYYFPTLKQVAQLHWRISKKNFSPRKILRRLIRDFSYLTITGLAAIKKHDLRLRGKGGLSVLNYHRLTDVGRQGMAISVSDFENQIRFLKKHYKLLGANDLKYCLQHKSVIPGLDNGLITFDDVDEDSLVNALPILMKYGCPAIFFVSVAFLETGQYFEQKNELLPKLRSIDMTWRRLLESLPNQISLGLHSPAQANLAHIGYGQAVDVIGQSMTAFYRHLGQSPEWMSCPSGTKDSISASLIAHLQKNTNICGLFSVTGRINYSPLNPFDIQRINIGNGDRGLAFLYKLRGGLSSLWPGGSSANLRQAPPV